MKKSTNKTYAIVLAGGSGKRMGTEVPKVLLSLNGTPALVYSLNAFNSSVLIDGIILVCPEDNIDQYKSLAKEHNIDKLISIVAGGAERTNSVYNGLCALNDCEYVLIHDGARPMLKTEYIDAVLEKCKAKRSAIAAKPIINTIKKVSDNEIISTVDRSQLWEVYTPQCFEYDFIKKAYDYVIKNNIAITDDASALETIGEKACVVDIAQRDFKLTTPSDIELVEKLMADKTEIRVGLGFDVHRFAENRELIIGGVKIPYKLGLLGHSDADVLTHAIMDAVLGAAGLPDIGQLFPDLSAEFKDIYSITLLKRVMEKVMDAGFAVNNIDAVIACEAPKIAPHSDKMIKCLSDALLCDADRINIKGTTTEKLGFEGRGEGISARCIASLSKARA